MANGGVPTILSKQDMGSIFAGGFQPAAGGFNHVNGEHQVSSSPSFLASMGVPMSASEIRYDGPQIHAPREDAGSAPCGMG